MNILIELWIGFQLIWLFCNMSTIFLAYSFLTCLHCSTVIKAISDLVIFCLKTWTLWFLLHYGYTMEFILSKSVCILCKQYGKRDCYTDAAMKGFLTFLHGRKTTSSLSCSWFWSKAGCSSQGSTYQGVIWLNFRIVFFMNLCLSCYIFCPFIGKMYFIWLN